MVQLWAPWLSWCASYSPSHHHVEDRGLETPPVKGEEGQNSERSHRGDGGPATAAAEGGRPMVKTEEPDPSPELVRLVLPIMSGLAARNREEEALRRGGGRFTEVGPRPGRGGRKMHPPSGAMWEEDEDGEAPEDEPRSPPARL